MLKIVFFIFWIAQPFKLRLVSFHFIDPKSIITMAEQAGERINELMRIMQELICLDWRTREHGDDDLDPNEVSAVSESLANYYRDTDRKAMTSSGRTPSELEVTVCAATTLFWPVFHSCLYGSSQSFDEIFPNAIQHFEAIFQAHLECSGKFLGGLFYNHSFQNFCALFGSKRVLDIVKLKVLIAVQNNTITLQELVLEIATFAGDVSPDALYLLIHMNPVLALFSQENKTGNTKQKGSTTLTISEKNAQD